MASALQKRRIRNFASEPMGEKKVTTIPGIGEVSGRMLEEKGYDKAYVLLGQFLVLRKDEDLFMEWLQDACHANRKQREDCYRCLKDWCDNWL